MNIMYASFDEVPSFKGASTHILSGLRQVIRRETVHLVTLGDTALRPREGLYHHPLAIREKNVVRRGLAFREQVGALIRKLKPELIHFRSPWEGLAAAASGVPSIFEVNGLPSMELPYYYRHANDKTLAVLRGWEEQCLNAARMVISPSAKIRAHLLQSYRLDPELAIEVLPNAYDPVPQRVLQPVSREPVPLRLVYLGTLSPWQGIAWSLKAFAVLRGRVTLDIFAPYAKHLTRKLLRRIRRLDLHQTVTLHEATHRGMLRELLPQYHFGFAPFLRTARNVEQGCFPLKLLEYLSHGLPVIASDLAISRQLLIPEHNALLFHANGMQSLLAALERAATLGEGCATLAQQAVESLRAHWTWDEYSARLCGLYQEVLGGNRRAGSQGSEVTGTLVPPTEI